MPARSSEKSSSLTLEENQPSSKWRWLWALVGRGRQWKWNWRDKPESAWENRFARRWNHWLLRLVPASDSSPNVRAKMENLEFLDTSKIWSEWLWGRLTPADFWTFCLFWVFVRNSPLCVLMYFRFEESDQILSIPLPCSLSCLFFHCDVKPGDELLHGSSRNTRGSQMEKIETPAFLCTDYAEIFTPTHLNQLCSGKVWLLAWARKLLFQAAQHENFRLGLPVLSPLWAVFLSCSKGFLCLICCPCAVWP